MLNQLRFNSLFIPFSSAISSRGNLLPIALERGSVPGC
jgi:hypothetical protein